MRLYIISVIWLCSSISSLNAQSSSLFGEISRYDLETSLYPQEKGAEAVVLFDMASAKMVFNDGFKIEFTRHVRIKIFKPSGYNQANIQIPFTTDDKILKLKACTHNIENDLQVRTDVGRKQFYNEKINAYRNQVRFSFPNVREGSVIEFEYTIQQEEIRNYHSFVFQRSVPVRSVSYKAVIPAYFNYTIDFNSNGIIQQRHSVQTGYISSYSTDFHFYEWYGNNLPAFQPEPMMPESNDFFASVQFALMDLNFPNFYFEVSPTYSKLSQNLLENSLIGGQLNNQNLFSKVVDGITDKNDSPIIKLRKIYNHVQQHMQWNGYEQLFPEVNLTRAYRDQSASNAEINLMLVNMLRYVGIPADPVVLSTRDNGKINMYVAIAGNLNYMVCVARIDGKDILLDATDKYRPEGLLPFKCLNGYGWVVNQQSGKWIELVSDQNNTIIENFELELVDDYLKGKVNISFMGYEASQMRKLLKTEGETGFREEEVLESGKIEISNLRFYNIDSLTLPLKIGFDVVVRHTIHNTDDFSFFNPFLNIFCDFLNTWVKDNRTFPIDFGCPLLHSFNCAIRMPGGIEIVELPRPARVKLPKEEAQFISGITMIDNSLIISGKMNISKTRFETNEYPAFREFYTQVNKKCNEMILYRSTLN